MGHQTLSMLLTAAVSTIFITGFAPGKRALADQKQPDYTSRVPKFTFADTLEEQEAQLRTNPLMERFVRSRRKMAGDRYRPIYHYVNPEGKLNDGNGVVFWAILILEWTGHLSLVQVPTIYDKHLPFLLTLVTSFPLRASGYQ